jgi:hypothetical protein
LKGVYRKKLGRLDMVKFQVPGPEVTSNYHSFTALGIRKRLGDVRLVCFTALRTKFQDDRKEVKTGAVADSGGESGRPDFLFQKWPEIMMLR